MRTSTIGSCIILTLFLAACDATSASAPGTAVVEPSAMTSHAGPPIETTYLLTITGFKPISQTVLPSGVVIQDNELIFVMTGDWVGTVLARTRQVIHTNGLITNNATFEFAGTVLGLAGTVEYSHASVFDRSGGSLVVKAGHNAILRGTGALENLRGEGSGQAVGPGVFAGEFSVHFAP